MLQLEDDRFRSHPSFVLAVCNMYLRWQCVTIGRIVAQKEAKDLTVEELQNKVLVDNDLEILSKLSYYGKREKRGKKCITTTDDTITWRREGQLVDLK